MSAPDNALLDIFPPKIWATGNDTSGEWTAKRPTAQWVPSGTPNWLIVGYVKRDPAVLAALPEVRDMMRRAYWLGMNAYTGESGAEEHELKKAACEHDLDGIIAAAIRAKGGEA